MSDPVAIGYDSFYTYLDTDNKQYYIYVFNNASVLDQNNKKLKEIKGEEILKEEEYLYARNPYILDKDIIISSHQNKHLLPFGECVLKENKNRNTSIGFIINDAPAEFDYPWEFEENKKYLDTIL